MKRTCKVAVVAVMFLAAAPVVTMADSVNGYMRRDGTYVQPYQRSERNNSYNDGSEKICSKFVVKYRKLSY